MLLNGIRSPLKFLCIAALSGPTTAMAKDTGPQLQGDRPVVALSAVHGKVVRKAKLQVSNPTDTEVPADFQVTGKDAALFKATAAAEVVPAGGSITLEIEFSAPDFPGRFSAVLQHADPSASALASLQAVGLAAFEGKNEPSLQSIVHALGIPLDVGGSQLELDTAKELIGESIPASYFRPAGPGKIRVTPLARFSPPGVTPFGIVRAGEAELIEIGRLADVSEQVPDAHQTLFPPLDGSAYPLEFEAPPQPFAFYMKGHKFNSFTDPKLKTDATIAHTARVFPVTLFQGKPIRNAYLIGFEEASNGDYQDAAFLVENITPAQD
jgi:hypothetical protein